MGRSGVTYLEVAKAATQLVEQNLSPTIESVRGLLKTGSYSTLNKHLREWRNQQGNPSPLEAQLPEFLLSTVKGLYEAIQADASQKVAAIEVEHTKLRTGFENKLAELEQAYNQSVQANKTLEETLQQLIEKNNSLEQHIDAQKKVSEEKIAELHLTRLRLDDKKSDIETLKEQIKYAQANLEHYRESTRQEREKEQDAFETKLTNLEQRLQQAKNSLSSSKAEVHHLLNQKKDLEQSLTALNQTYTQLQKTCHTLELDKQKQALSHNQLQKEFETLQQMNQNLLLKAEKDKTTINSLVIQAEKGKEKICGLETALNKVEDSIVGLTKKNLFLVQEKTQLAVALSKLESTE